MLIVKDNKILIIEFSFENERKNEKTSQCIVYKEMMKQYLSKDLDYKVYIFMYSPSTKENERSLNNQIEKCINELNIFFDPFKDMKELYTRTNN